MCYYVPRNARNKGDRLRKINIVQFTHTHYTYLRIGYSERIETQKQSNHVIYAKCKRIRAGIALNANGLSYVTRIRGIEQQFVDIDYSSIQE